MTITIKKISEKNELKKFILFPFKLYKGNNCWVPPLITSEYKTLSDKNPAREFCDCALWLAYKDGEVVGRIAGIINRHANEKWNENEVRFGWIDFIDDAEVSRGLINAVAEWGHNKGMTRICGPLGFSDMDYEGMLIEGFDQLGTMATIYNYPYYPKHMEALGFKKDADWIEFKIYIPDAIPEKHKRIAQLVQKKYELNIVKYTSHKKIAHDYGQKIFELINEAFEPLYGYVALTQKQRDEYVKEYLPIVNLKMVTLITDKNGELVGAGISIPSMSRALQKAHGRMFPFGWWHLLRALHVKNNRVLDLMLVAVKPEYQNKGVNALLFYDLIPVYQQLGFEYAESNVELEVNNKVQSQWEYFKTEQHKRRRAFAKEINI